MGNVYELCEFLGGDKWKVRCTKCGKIQEQSMSNMKVHKKETCTYCKYPDYSPATHKEVEVLLNCPLTKDFIITTNLV